MTDTPTSQAVIETTSHSVQEQLEAVLVSFELISQSASEGLWDMLYPADGVIGPQTPFWWSDQFRKLLGYQNESGFPQCARQLGFTLTSGTTKTSPLRPFQPTYSTKVVRPPTTV